MTGILYLFFISGVSKMKEGSTHVKLVGVASDNVDGSHFE
jgi:hypothetical protein